MDSERQPPLSREEVMKSRGQLQWTSARVFVILMFWIAMAVCLSLAVEIIMSSKCAPVLNKLPSVPPVHIAFTPLLSRYENA
ncbi:unnamed protein product [Leptidea sinapis]|uniref:Solute carrier family 3 member 2 N-terminal domain-containing protein n=1 Tax=Leptidea sinapis TaxID=189913 RepID=A0A5E4QRJ1_9NEOP|nr:unnamed protein product [Leptidea sinapis]